MKIPEELTELQRCKQANLEVLLHTQRLAEHLRTQIDILLEVVRSSKDVYTDHANYITQIIEQQKKQDDGKNQDKTATDI